MKVSPEIKITKDGSNTLFLHHIDEHYHSVHGAIQESLHVFIKNGIQNISRDKCLINILEIGFGTGLNALLTLDYSAMCMKVIIKQLIKFIMIINF